MGKNNPIFKIEASGKTRPAHPIIPDNLSTEHIPMFHWFDAFGADLSNIDLSVLGDKIEYMNFDNDTTFPSADKLPDGFNPQKLLENGKNPGLGIRDLHKQGITGKGVTVAIIDGVFNITHQEIKDNVIHYELVGVPNNWEAEYHAPCVSSLLCGKTTGVAPDVKLVFFASTMSRPSYPDEQPFVTSKGIKNYFGYYTTALQKILDMNSKLPDEEKISAVSISTGRLNRDEKCSATIRKLIDSGVMVLTCGDAYLFHGDIADFVTADRLPNTDPDDVNSYTYGFIGEDPKGKPNGIMVPSGGRTTAGNTSDTNYQYWGKNGGYSWATPYMVGVYALAKQVYPNLTPLKFFETARNTAYPVASSNGCHNVLIQPKKLIEQLQQELLLQKQMKKTNQKD